MLRLDGNHSIFDIGSELELDYWLVREYIEKFRVKGLIEREYIPSEAQSE